jgi:hypothetical protein
VTGDGVAATALPAYLAMPSGGGGHPSSDIHGRLTEASGGEREITAELARELAAWVVLDFQESCLTLLTSGAAARPGPTGPGADPTDSGTDWLEARRRLRAGDDWSGARRRLYASTDWSGARRRLHADAGGRASRFALCRGAALLMHAALVGLARGASQDAFAYAAVRKVNGRPLIQCELIAARLSSIATHEVVGDLQFCRLCDLSAMPGGEEERDVAQRELQRAALATVVESAHVRGGHGFVQCEDPGRRVETAHAVLTHLATPAAR